MKQVEFYFCKKKKNGVALFIDYSIIVVENQFFPALLPYYCPRLICIIVSCKICIFLLAGNMNNKKYTTFHTTDSNKIMNVNKNKCSNFFV